MNAVRMLPLLAATLALAACGGERADTAPAADSVAVAPAPAARAAGTPADSAVAAAAARESAGAFVDPNSATREQLLAIPGFDAALADAVVAGRPFADMRAVDAILAPRLGEPQRDSVYAVLWKPIDPNTATEEEIMLIPGVGKRMAHEFEEYRPWTNGAHFQREIGKYVDPAEVARLQKYTTLQ
jgi:DNA uptake protein ComE-like DNA-binding protein